MRRRLFNLTAILSLVALSIITAAVFSSAALTRNTLHSTVTPPIHRSTTYKLYRGQVEIFRNDVPLVGGIMPALEDRFQFLWDGFMPPGVKVIAGFDSQPLAVLRGPAGSAAHYIAFPVWPLVLPFLIAPIRWFRAWSRERRSRRLDASTAFPVKVS